MYLNVTGLRARRTLLILVEHAAVVLTVLGAALLRLGLPDSPFSTAGGLLWRAMFVAVVLQLCMHYFDLYDVRTVADRRDLVVGLLRALGVALAILAMIYFWVPSLIVGRGIFGFAALPIVVVIAGWRIAFEWLSLRSNPTERLLIVGTSSAANNLARELFERRSELGVEIVGFVDVEQATPSGPLVGRGLVGVIADIPSIVKMHRVDRVVVSLADARGKFNMQELLDMKLNQGVRFDHLASVYEQYTGKIAVENLRPSWMIFSEGFRKSQGRAVVKRASDIALALVGLLLSAPLLLGVAAVLRLASAGPVLYSQRRVGRDGKLFTIHKFRSMRVDAEAGTGAVWATTSDPRVTKIGRLLRRTRLDELPQLWNVLVGEMSFVGPRPERPEFVSQLTTRIPFYGARHTVRPGLTGWAQIRHGYGATFEDAQEKLQLDLFYIKNLSFAFDVFIVLETTKTILMRRGS